MVWLKSNAEDEEMRLCSRCWSEIDDEDEEAAYLGLTAEALRSIRHDDRWGNQVLSYGKKRKKKRIQVRMRGNRFVKFYENQQKF